MEQALMDTGIVAYLAFLAIAGWAIIYLMERGILVLHERRPTWTVYFPIAAASGSFGLAAGLIAKWNI